jgi:thiosulfate/3-mercaptopyruvate sulfurtransferase
MKSFSQKFFSAAALLAACVSGAYAQSELDSLVDVQWLKAHIDDPDLVIVDASVTIEPDEETGYRIVNGRPAFEQGHIPGAAFADLMGELSDKDSDLQFDVPAPGQFAKAMGALGVGDESRVVIYDSSNSAWAARVWWMLRWIGFDNAALLDGGLNAWKAHGGALESGAISPEPRTLSVNLRPELIVGSGEVLAAVDDDDINIIDSLPEAQYRGDMQMYARPGHIPGASNVPSSSALGEDGRFRSDEELAALFDGDKEGRAITYCGGGIAASSNAFVMHRLGYKDVAVYTASLQEWASDPELPLEVTPKAEE